MGLLRFRVGFVGNTGREYIVVRSGLFTLYEHILVQYNAAVTHINSPVSLLVKRAPVYLRDVMIYPCADRKDFVRLSHIILGGERIKAVKPVRTPMKAFLGYCAVPLCWSGVFAALLTFIYVSEELRGAQLIKTALYGGLFVSLYSAVICLFYIRHSGISFNKRLCVLGVKRSLRMYTAVFPKDTIEVGTISQSVFQRRSGLCNFKISTSQKQGFNLKQLPINKLN